MIYVDLSEGKGRGVFAERRIDTNTILCYTYSWLLTPQDIELYDRTSVSGHWFNHPSLENYGLLPLGLAALVNHSDTPNASLTWKVTDLGCVGVLVSLRAIETDEEIYINYVADNRNTKDDITRRHGDESWLR